MQIKAKYLEKLKYYLDRNTKVTMKDLKDYYHIKDKNNFF